MLNIEIDKKSGFCFGVVKAISKAEEELAKGEYCIAWVTLYTMNRKLNG